MRPKVIIESAHRAGQGFTQSENLKFTKKMCERALQHKLNPFASHLFFTIFMNDNQKSERNLGINLGVDWGLAAADEIWVCLRPGEHPTEGMESSVEQYIRAGKKVLVMEFLPNGQHVKDLETHN